MQLVRKAMAIIIKPDGTVKFDDSVADDLRQATINHLVDMGHHIGNVHGTRHVKILNWQPPK